MLKGKEKETGEDHKFTKGGETSEKETVEVQSHPKAVRGHCEPHVRTATLNAERLNGPAENYRAAGRIKHKTQPRVS